MKRHLIRMMLTLILCLIPAAVYALDTDTWDGYLSIRSEAAEADADTFGMKADTLLPVMGAPFEEAWRGAKGKAAVSLRESFSLLGTLQDQTWAMISYSISENADRIGWVRIDPDQCSLPGSSDMTMERRLCRVLRKTPATDDPLESGRVIRTLSPGEEVIGILDIGDQICVETLVDGKIAWLFVRSEALEEIPLVSVEGHTVRVDDRVTVMGSCSVVPPDSGNPSDYGCIAQAGYVPLR